MNLILIEHLINLHSSPRTMFEHQRAKIKELEDSHQQQKTRPEHMGGFGAPFYNVMGNVEVGLHIHNECKQLRLSVPISEILTDGWLHDLGRYY
jgi:hypothetical protein